MSKKTFYITTPIYYPSGNLHIGNSYTTVLCDALNRYKRLRGYETYYLTGMDEHGQKIETVAKELGIKPQEQVDRIAEETKNLWEVLHIDYDDFIRTTEERHETVVEQIFEQLLAQDDIYLGEYEGYYCMPDESFFTETQLGENKTCPDCGRPTTLVKEESYFLRLSKYQDRLLDFIEQNPDFITPESRKNEVVSFIKQGLIDLSVSRTSFDWGVKVKSNPKHVIYVWIDALSNYISALGYKSDNTTLYDKYWLGDEVVHVVGKDILRFHAIYWPIMLFALNVPVNFKLYAHGWYLMKEGKMSKSKGTVIYPKPIIEKYGLDTLRYYLLRELPYSSDGLFTPEDFVGRVNYDLANDFGNLLNRTINMANKYFNSNITKVNPALYQDLISPQTQASDDKVPFGVLERKLQDKVKSTIKAYKTNFDALKVSNAIQELWSLISSTNRYIDETAPWVLAKDPAMKPALESVLYNLIETLRHIGILLQPVLLDASKKLFEQLQIPAHLQTWDSLEFGSLYHITVTTSPEPIFPRLDKKKEEAYLLDLLPKKQEKKPEVKEESFINIDDFSKVELVVGKVVSCEKHPDADKLLVSQVDTGDKVRQIVSGISSFYSPTDMVGKKVVIVKNLKPVKLRGVLSEGMLLAGKNKKELEVLEVSNLQPGDKIS